MIKILVVDDEPHVAALTVLKLQQLAPQWRVDVLCDPMEAADAVVQEEYDAIVTDFDMPVLSGDQLLQTVARRRPLTVRVLVTTRLDVGNQVMAIGAAHRFFAKPIDFQALVVALHKALALRKRIRGSGTRSALNSVTSLPSPPRTYFSVQRLLASKGFHLSRLVELLKQEVALSSLMLKAANSVYYGSRTPIDSLDKAVSLLGLNTVVSLVLGAEIFSKIDARTSKRFGVEQLFEHSARVAATAANLAERIPETRHLKDLAYTGGLLHDIGKLVCIHTMGGAYEMIVKRSAAERPDLWRDELEMMGASHQEIGAYVLTLWGIPDPIVEAAAFHHQPILQPSPEVSVLTFVTAANLLDHGLPSADAIDGAPEVDEYFTSLGTRARELLIT